MATKTNLIARVRRLIDAGQWAKDDNSADGSATYYVDNFPCVISDVTVKVAGVTKTETTDYVLNKDIGQITWVSTPASGSALVIIYKYYTFTDTQIWNYVVNEGIDELELRNSQEDFDYDSASDTITPTPSDIDEYCIALCTAITMRDNEDNKFINDGIKVREGDTSIDTTSGSDRDKSIKRWEDKLDKILSNKKFNEAITGCDRVPLYTWDLLQQDQWDE